MDPRERPEFDRNQRAPSLSVQSYAVEFGVAILQRREDGLIALVRQASDICSAAGDPALLASCVNAPVRVHDTALCLAVQHRMPRGAMELIQAGARLDLHGAANRSPLCMAIESRQEELALAMIAASRGDAPVLGGFGQREEPPILMALKDKQQGVASALAGAGAFLGHSNRVGTTPLALACELGLSKAAAAIAKAMAPATAPDPDECAKLRAGSAGSWSVNRPGKSGKSPWEISFPLGGDELCAALIAAEAETPWRAEDGAPKNPLLRAIETGMPLSALAFARSKGAKALFEDASPGHGYILRAAKAGMEDVCLALLGAGFAWDEMAADAALRKGMAPLARAIAESAKAVGDAHVATLIEHRLGIAEGWPKPESAQAAEGFPHQAPGEWPLDLAKAIAASRDRLQGWAKKSTGPRAKVPTKARGR